MILTPPPPSSYSYCYTLSSGRYPVHFHLSDDSPSIVSDNAIVQSNQRCIVVHNTNGVTVDNNVAHDTSGHCYVTETGLEEQNVFSNNLGAKTRKLQFSNGQSDSPGFHGKHIAATLWVRNMKNEFYGNVAAGSESVGWWFEMKDSKVPMLSTTPVSSFLDNVAHSAKSNGMTTYKPGWKPSEPAVFDNIKIYKNNGESGLKFHITSTLTIQNSFFADNKVSIRYGVWNGGVTLRDSKIIALSNDAKLRNGLSCPATSSGIYASYNNYPHGTTPKAIDLDNVVMERFTCGSKVIRPYFDNRQDARGMGNSIQASVTITDSVEKANPSFGCSSKEKYVFLEDVGGGLGPASMGSEPGFILRNSGHMKAFLPADACEPLPYGGTWSDGTQCNAFCKNVCLRFFHISPGISSATKLVLSQGNVTYAYYLDTDYDKFRMVLPSGNYHGQFYDDNGIEVVAQSVSISAFRAPKCGDYADENSFTFTTLEPTSVPSSTPSISSAPTWNPARKVRIRSDNCEKYLYVKSDKKRGMRLSPEPVGEIEVTLKKVACRSSLGHYHWNKLTVPCYELLWEQSNNLRLNAETSQSWTNGIKAWSGDYDTKFWYFKSVPCTNSVGDDCVLIRNAENGRSLYHGGTHCDKLGASPKGTKDYIFTNVDYRWKFVDILEDNADCSAEGVACSTNSDCCSHYCHGDGHCAR